MATGDSIAIIQGRYNDVVTYTYEGAAQSSSSSGGSRTSSNAWLHFVRCIWRL